MSQSRAFRFDNSWNLDVDYSWSVVDQVFHQMNDGETMIVVFSSRSYVDRFRSQYVTKHTMTKTIFLPKIDGLWANEVAEKAKKELPKKFLKRGEEILFRRGDSVVIIGSQIFAYREDLPKIYEILKMKKPEKYIICDSENAKLAEFLSYEEARKQLDHLRSTEYLPSLQIKIV